MKDLIVEGREIQEKFQTSITEEEEYEKIISSNDVRVINDAQNAVVVIPRNYAAVRQIILNTKWVSTFSNVAFTRYQKQKYTMYFIILKKTSPNYNNMLYKKIAVVISPSGEYTCYDSSGSLIDIINIQKLTGISRTLLKPIK